MFFVACTRVKTILEQFSRTQFFTRSMNNKKHIPPVFQPFVRFSRISPEPLELQKNKFHLFVSFSEKLPTEKIIFQIRWQYQIGFEKFFF